jgi:flagellar assembly factor FliW
LKISTTRFGTIEVSDEEIIYFPSGLAGFPEARRFVLVEHREGSPFIWLQSVDEGALAFVLTDPLLFKSDYAVELGPEDFEELGLQKGANGFRTLVVINLSLGSPPQMTANLLGPIVINPQQNRAKQVILYRSGYSHRHPFGPNGNHP